ncbi:MAG: triose-phosphate isomerase [Bacteroidales bacterium]
MRRKIVAGNWKMNMKLNEGIELARSLKDHYAGKPETKAEVVLCTPFIHLPAVSELLKGNAIKCGAQNCASEVSGAYTGEVSADMIKSTGAEYVIIGHSERRSYYNETDQLLNKKTRIALNTGLKVIFCCGEVLAERENKTFFEVVRRQVEEGILNLTADELGKVVIAYEPVWAIGTGLTATPQQAQEMHAYIRGLVESKFGSKIAGEIRILYGGSCKPSNAAEIFSMPDVDGGLIGGASLKKEDFTGIIDAA